MVKNKHEKNLIKQARKTHVNNLKRKSRKYKLISTGSRKIKTSNGESIVIINAPENFTVYNFPSNFEYSILFLLNLEKYGNQLDVKKIVVNFSHTKTIKAAAVVLLFAVIEKIIQDKKKKVTIEFLGSNKYTLKIMNYIQESGLSSLCKTGKPENCFNRQYLHIISGQGGAYRDEIVDFIMEKIYANNMNAVLENAYSSAIQEAINNVAAHAYEKNEATKKWWVKCSYIKNEKQLYLVIYDSGIGIPETFPGENVDFKDLDEIDSYTESQIELLLESLNQEGRCLTKKEFMSLLKNNKDNNLADFAKIKDSVKIFAAMVGNLTRRTSEVESQKHGQGSKSIKGLVKNNDNGVLWIFSNHGLVKYYGDKIAKDADIIDLPSPIKGTLIQWNIKVEP